MNPTRFCLVLLAVVVASVVPVLGQPIPPGGAGDGPPIELTCVGVMAPAVVHVQAGGVPAEHGVSPLDTRYEWDFGDPGSKYNNLPGWNASHVYDKPGKYTITLTVRMAGGKTLTRTTWVRIAPDQRKKVYVSGNGNDALDGLGPARAVRTAARAFKLAGDGDAWVLFRRGDVFEISEPISIGGSGIRVGNYGRTAADDWSTGVQLKPPPGAAAPARPAAEALPVLKKVQAPPKQESMFVVTRGCQDLLVEGLEFDSIWDLQSEYKRKKVPARAFTVGGKNIGFRWCSFRNLTDGINSELSPTGMLVQECTFSDEIRGYCIYSIGTDHAYVGNVMADSKQEHLIRASEPGVTRVLVAYNHLSRPTNYKGSIEFRCASWFYVASNYINGGTLRVGPQEQDKASTPDWKQIKCEWGVIQDNRVDNVFFNVRLGTYHVMFRNNVIRQDRVGENEPTWAIIIACDKPGYDDVRKVGDVRIAHNTVIQSGKKGMFIFVQGRPAGLTIRQNVYVAPNLTPGASNAGIYLTSDLQGINEIAGNVFPAGVGGQHRVGSKPVGRDEWLRQSGAKDERYGAVPLDADDNVPLQTGAGAKLGPDKRGRAAKAGADATSPANPAGAAR